MPFRQKRAEVSPRKAAPGAEPALISELHQLVVERLEDDVRGIADEPMQLRQQVRELVTEALSLRGYATPTDSVDAVVEDVCRELNGFGPLEPLLADDTISDILINGHRQVYVERRGRLEPCQLAFLDDDHILRVVRRMLAPLGKRLDESSPMVDARLADGSRVNAIIAPLSLNGPSVSIRKFRREALTGQDLVAMGSVPANLMTFLRRAVEERCNLLVSGGTGAGKTTLLNVLSAAIPPQQRVVTIEDSAELQLASHHVVRLETRAPNIEGEGEVGASALVKNALRMRPDRILLGESRGDEVLDMLQAMNTGHQGSMSTVHANSAADAVVRLEMMVRMSRFQGTDALVRQIITTALDLIVHVARDSSGQRRVAEVLRVVGLRQGEVVLEPLYREGQPVTDHLTARPADQASAVCWPRLLAALVDGAEEAHS
ncbi:CpaF family protein [Halomonas sp. DP5Y7-2]|uniref:CpaF family protein n=1 Tax=Halomonas sp. DP5Y7-2 TaxID=2859076 RepID=UPI001C99CECF|nr:CpaF family protein [Halomonas sp. DP5Y7-2]MBY5985645.1 CpaF family protein [Halomonas sp. DP5Y7-2]